MTASLTCIQATSKLAKPANYRQNTRPRLKAETDRSKERGLGEGQQKKVETVSGAVIVLGEDTNATNITNAGTLNVFPVRARLMALIY